MTEETRRKKSIKSALERILNEYPEAQKVSERYRLMRAVLSEEYGNLIKDTSKELMLQFLKDTVYIDRQIRYQTEGKDEDTKLELSQQTAEDIRTGVY